MKSLALAVSLAAVALVGCQSTDSTQTADLVANDACPYSGRPVDPDMAFQVGNKEVRTCCGDCLDKAKQNPEEAVAKAFPND